MQRRRGQGDSRDLKFAAGPQGSSQELRLEGAGIGDEHAYDRSIRDCGSDGLLGGAVGRRGRSSQAGFHSLIMHERTGAGCRVDHNGIVMNREYRAYFGRPPLVHQNLGGWFAAALAQSSESQSWQPISRFRHSLDVSLFTIHVGGQHFPSLVVLQVKRYLRATAQSPELHHLPF